ncbi:MAG: type pilus assembly protein PilC, partial [Solirubrobacterales bacterium]|nr:type pilus assembly protein PilC [Solirubrobacterales bacterium]
MASATTFEFRAMDLAGSTSSGELEADSKAAVGEQLRLRGLIVLDVSEKSNPVNIEDLFKGWQGIDKRELAIFSRQFATLVASGMPMLRTLQTLEDQTQDEQIKGAISGLRSDVEAGSSLEQGMERYPKVFDRLFRAMVRSGEQSGRLDEVLDRVAFQVEKQDALRRQVKSAMMYPTLVFTFAVVVLVAIVALVIPIFANIFEEMAEDNPAEATGLPLPTQVCVDASNALTGYWFIIFPAIAALVFGFFKWKATEQGGKAWDRAKLRLPFK